MLYIKKFLNKVGKSPLEISKDDIRSYLKGLNQSQTATHCNTLKSLKVFFRDFLDRPELVDTFRFPRQNFKPKSVPSREDLNNFYEAIDTPKEKALFLLYASSGLRRNEVLSLLVSDVDFEKRMIKPKTHTGDTKKAWLSFFNEEASTALKQYLSLKKGKNPKLFPMPTSGMHKLWRTAVNFTGVNITPKRLREWFCCEMASLGVSDSYIDSFCGRIPRSVLAKHYLDYSPQRMKEIYEKANLRIISR